MTECQSAAPQPCHLTINSREQEVDKVDVRDLAVLSSSATTVDTARDVDVIVDSQLQ